MAKINFLMNVLKTNLILFQMLIIKDKYSFKLKKNINMKSGKFLKILISSNLQNKVGVLVIFYYFFHSLLKALL